MAMGRESKQITKIPNLYDPTPLYFIFKLQKYNGAELTAAQEIKTGTKPPDGRHILQISNIGCFGKRTFGRGARGNLAPEYGLTCRCIMKLLPTAAAV